MSTRAAAVVLARVGHLHDGAVAGVVTEPVVDRLEMIDVEHQQRQRPLIARKALPFGFGPGEKMAPVEQPRQAVRDGEPLVFLGEPHQVGDVREGQHAAAAGQHGALRPDGPAVAHGHVHGGRVAGKHQRDAAGEKIVELVGRQAQRAGDPVVVHQVREKRPAGSPARRTPSTACGRRGS